MLSTVNLRPSWVSQTCPATLFNTVLFSPFSSFVFVPTPLVTHVLPLHVLTNLLIALRVTGWKLLSHAQTTSRHVHGLLAVSLRKW